MTVGLSYNFLIGFNNGVSCKRETLLVFGNKSLLYPQFLEDAGFPLDFSLGINRKEKKIVASLSNLNSIGRDVANSSETSAVKRWPQVSRT